MPTPRDDEFNGSSLDPKWTWVNDTLVDCSYDFTSNPGGLTLNIGATASGEIGGGNVPYIIQGNNYTDYYAEIGITLFDANADTQEAGIFLKYNATNYVMLKKWRDTGAVYKISSYEMSGGVWSLKSTVAYPDNNNIVLRIKWFDGKISFFYKKEEDVSFTQLGSDLTPANNYDNADVGLFGSVGTFSTVFDYFHLRSLINVETNGDIEIRLINSKITNGDITIKIRAYNPVVGFEVRQDLLLPINHLLWKNPVPAWTKMFGMIDLPSVGGATFIGGTATEASIMKLSTDGLVVDTTIGKDHYGMYEFVYPTSFTAANITSVAADMKVISSTDLGEEILLQLINGVNYVNMYIHTDRIGFNGWEYLMDTTDDFHNYRIEIKNGTAQFFVDYLLVKTMDVSALTSSANRIRFGDGDNTTSRVSKSNWKTVEISDGTYAPQFIGARILRKLNSYPTNPNDGTILADDTVANYIDDAYKTDRKTVYYAAFVHYF